MSGFIQIIMLLIQIFPAALKAIAAWRDFHKQKLTSANRAALAKDIKLAVGDMVKTKDTGNLREKLKNLGKPRKPADAPNSQNLS